MYGLQFKQLMLSIDPDEEDDDDMPPQQKTETNPPVLQEPKSEGAGALFVLDYRGRLELLFKYHSVMSLF